MLAWITVKRRRIIWEQMWEKCGEKIFGGFLRVGLSLGVGEVGTRGRVLGVGEGMSTRERAEARVKHFAWVLL